MKIIELPSGTIFNLRNVTFISPIYLNTEGAFGEDKERKLYDICFCGGERIVYMDDSYPREKLIQQWRLSEGDSFPSPGLTE